MKVLHLLASGGTGGIEVLCKNIAVNSSIDNRWVVLFHEGEIYNELKEKGINIFSVSNLSFYKKIKELSRYCNNEHIDIIVVHHGGISCNIVYCMLKKKNPKIKYIRYLHGCFDEYAFGNGKNKLKNILVKFIMQRAINASDCLIFISNAVKKTFENNFNIQRTKNVIIYNGISDNFLNEPIKRKENDDIINLIYIGRLVNVKGVDILIDAFSKLKNNDNNYFLTIVGDGIEKQNLEKKVKELQIENFVKFVGRQKDVINWLDESDIFIYPSIWEEGFGISVVEAMSRSCIPITFNKGGLSEIIENSYNGVLVEDTNSFALANAIENLKITNELKNNAIRTAQKFSIKNVIENLENTYKNI